MSSVVVSPETGIPADGASSARIEVTLRDSAGDEITGLEVVIEASGSGNVITQSGGPSGADGRALGSIASTVVETKTIRVTVGDVLLEDQPSVTFVEGEPAHLVFVTEPSTVQAGVAMRPEVRVAVEAADGTRIESAAIPITLAIEGGAIDATLSGGMVAAAGGVATFGEISVDREGMGYRLVATAEGLGPATSAAFDVNPGPPVQLVFVLSPVDTVAGEAIPELRVGVADAGGNVLTSAPPTAITIALGENPAGDTLGGVVDRVSVEGAAMFPGLVLTRAAMGYTLVASAPGLASAESRELAILPGAATRIAFTVQPPDGEVGVALAPAPVVSLLDRFDNVASAGSASVSMALGPGAAGAALGGTTVVATRGGAASFDTLTVDTPGEGYTLVASAGSFGPITSEPFTVDCVNVEAPPVEPLGSSCDLRFPPAASIACDVPDTGSVYYVSASVGSDRNDGRTAGTPWRTLCKAVAAAPAGSTLRVATGTYLTARVRVDQALTIKGGYDAGFTRWDPDASPTTFAGRVELHHAQAVFAGFRVITRMSEPDPGGVGLHFAGAGSFVRNYFELVESDDAEVGSVVTFLYATTFYGSSSYLCNDVYLRASMAPRAAVLVRLRHERGGVGGVGTFAHNRACFDGGGDRFGDYVIDAPGWIISDNVLESARGTIISTSDFGVVANNTIVADSATVVAASGTWRAVNNLVAHRSPASGSTDTTAYASIECTANLVFGSGLRNRLCSDFDGAAPGATLASVFVDPAAGDFRPRATGPAAGAGANLFGDATYGDLRTDLLQRPRPATGAWDIGALSTP